MRLDGSVRLLAMLSRGVVGGGEFAEHFGQAGGNRLAGEDFITTRRADGRPIRREEEYGRVV